MTTTYYIACDLGAESGRVMEGSLNNGKLMLSELHRFSNQPIKDKDSLYWDIPKLFQEVLVGLHKAAELEDQVAGVSCDSRSEEHTSELQSRLHLVCRLLLEK